MKLTLHRGVRGHLSYTLEIDNIESNLKAGLEEYDKIEKIVHKHIERVAEEIKERKAKKKGATVATD